MSRVKQTCKFRNDTFSAAGIIPYDEKGLWLILEKKKGNHEYTDAGGKYRFEDATVFGCAVREWNEETYFSHVIDNRRFERVKKIPLFVNGRNGKKTYVSFLVDAKPFNISPERFDKYRKKFIKNHDHIPDQVLAPYIKTTKLVHISYDEIEPLISGELHYSASSRLELLLKGVPKALNISCDKRYEIVDEISQIFDGWNKSQKTDSDKELYSGRLSEVSKYIDKIEFHEASGQDPNLLSIKVGENDVSMEYHNDISEIIERFQSKITL